MAATGKKVGVVLSGCGFLDGAEIHEATLTLLALDRAGAQVRAMAPDIAQMHVVDHSKGEPAPGESRRVIAEAARIARGKVSSLASVGAADLDALIFPGGFGAAKNLCSFAVDGQKMNVDPEVERLIREMHQAGKPMGFICIAPVLAARVLGDRHPRLTIGKDRATAAALEAMGATHVECSVEEAAVDEQNKIVSTPAYMLGPSISRVAIGIDRLVEKVLELA
ncbi:MAG: isoprenoid biosynthesis glyoxalase ElbB [Myxococcales bacterium]|jgi:enhancing lycopene biosynthesis protein 2